MKKKHIVPRPEPALDAGFSNFDIAPAIEKGPDILDISSGDVGDFDKDFDFGE